MIAADDFQANYGCFGTNFGCFAQEMVANVVGGVIKNLGDFMADMFAEAFKNTTISDTDWAVADGQFWFWVTVMSYVLLLVGVLQMIAPVILADVRRLFLIAGGYILAIPTAVFAIIAMRKLTGFGDLVTNSLVSSLQGGGMSQALLRLFGWTLDTDGVVHAAKDAGMWTDFRNATNGGSTGLGEWLLTLLIVGLVALASLFLQLAMAIRDFGLLALAATAPIAWMMIGQPKLAVWASRWCTLVVGLLFAKPLAAAVLVLSVALFSDTTTFATQVVAAGGVFLAAFSPAWAVGLVAISSAEARNALSNRPSVTNMITKASILSGAGRRLLGRR